MKKTCTYCHETKDTTEFYRNTNYKDNLMSRCKSCQRTISNKQYEKNAEKIKTRRRERYREQTEQTQS